MGQMDITGEDANADAPDARRFGSGLAFGFVSLLSATLWAAIALMVMELL